MKGATCDGRNNPHPTFEFDKRKATKPVLSKNKPLPHHTTHWGRKCIAQSHTNKITICTQSPQRNQPPVRNLPKRNRRGGACVPARTSAQRRFHTKNTRIVCGEFNDECALAGRHGRAHRHRPYPTSSNFQRMRTFMAEYPKKVSGCGLSRLNTPKR